MDKYSCKCLWCGDAYGGVYARVQLLLSCCSHHDVVTVMYYGWSVELCQREELGMPWIVSNMKHSTYVNRDNHNGYRGVRVEP